VPVQWTPEGIDDAPDPSVIGGNPGPPDQIHAVPDGHAFDGGIGQNGDAVACQPKNLGPDRAVRAMDNDPVAKTRRLRQTGQNKGPAPYIPHPANLRDKRHCADFRAQTCKDISHL
jgi:hypothetical protein